MLNTQNIIELVYWERRLRLWAQRCNEAKDDPILKQEALKGHANAEKGLLEILKKVEIDLENNA